VFSAPPLTPLVKKLIITLLVAFVTELMLQNFGGLDVIGLLALDPVHLSLATPVQVLSYVLIEDPRAVMGMLIGLVFMWLILSPFESSFGARRTLELALCGVIGAALATILAAQLMPITPYQYLGSRPVAYAGMAAMARVMQRGRMLFFGVVPMTSSQLLLVLVGLSLLEFLASKDHIMLAGSLGAMAAGMGYVRFMSRTPRKPGTRRPSSSRLRMVRGGAESAPPGPSDPPKWLN
jgi:membrane associated rhomboid family serine protease